MNYILIFEGNESGQENLDLDLIFFHPPLIPLQPLGGGKTLSLVGCCPTINRRRVGAVYDWARMVWLLLLCNGTRDD